MNLPVSLEQSGLFSPWGKAAATVFMSIGLLFAIYHETVFSLIHIWITSETFTHCFLIFPISGYLIWQRRTVLAGLLPHADYRALALIALLGFGWLLADLVDAVVVRQFALVAMVPALVWAVLGWHVVREIAFPLGFLLFSVPVGEALLPRMIDFTADFTVGMLRLTGMPVYREGTYFSIPSGDWSVVEACSGLRYLIASITLGCLFAYINFVSMTKRAVFILLAVIVPVFANGLRAYMIVMIGHLSGMRLAVGVDHIIYGWVFFGFVMALLFWLGSRWSEEPVLETGVQADPVAVGNWREGRKLAAVAAVALAIAYLWPTRAAYIDASAQLSQDALKLAPTAPRPPWRQAEPMTVWAPEYVGADAQERAFFTDGRHTVALFIKYYRTETQGRELVNSQNLLVAKKQEDWKMPGESLAAIRLGGRETQVLQGSVRSPEQNLLTWRWYWIAGSHTANDYLAKLFQARGKLLGGVTGEAGIILATDWKDEDVSGARAKAGLQDFIDAMLPSIEQTLADAADRRR